MHIPCWLEVTVPKAGILHSPVFYLWTAGMLMLSFTEHLARALHFAQSQCSRVGNTPIPTCGEWTVEGEETPQAGEPRLTYGINTPHERLPRERTPCWMREEHEGPRWRLSEARPVWADAEGGEQRARPGRSGEAPSLGRALIQTMNCRSPGRSFYPSSFFPDP